MNLKLVTNKDGHPDAPTINVNLQHANITTRWPCDICAGETEKTDTLAVFTHPVDGREAFICERCFEAGPAAINSRLSETAERFEAVARMYREIAEAAPVWNMPTQTAMERWHAEIQQREEQRFAEFSAYVESVAVDNSVPF